MISRSSKVSAKRWVVWEYRLYFTLIFLATLPHTIVLCFFERVGILKRKSYNNKGVVARAWNNAQIFTPMIFSA